MKNLLKRISSLFLAFILLFSLGSCKYVSSYKAIGLVRSQTNHSLETSFYSLEGQLVYKLKKTNNKNDGQISYSIEVEQGEIIIYYDIYSEKEKLVEVSSNQSVNDKGGYIEGGKSVYIIIEAKNSARGKVKIELNN